MEDNPHSWSGYRIQERHGHSAGDRILGSHRRSGPYRWCFYLSGIPWTKSISMNKFFSIVNKPVVVQTVNGPDIHKTRPLSQATSGYRVRDKERGMQKFSWTAGVTRTTGCSGSSGAPGAAPRLSYSVPMTGRRTACRPVSNYPSSSFFQKKTGTDLFLRSNDEFFW